MQGTLRSWDKAVGNVVGTLPRSFPSSEPALGLTLWPFVHWACWRPAVQEIYPSKVVTGPRDCSVLTLSGARCQACERLVRGKGVSSWEMLQILRRTKTLIRF